MMCLPLHKGIGCPSLASLSGLPGLPGQVIEFSLIFFHYRRNLTGSVKSVSRPGREPLGGVSVVLTSRAGLGGRPGWAPEVAERPCSAEQPESPRQ